MSIKLYFSAAPKQKTSPNFSNKLNAVKFVYKQ